MKNRKHVEVAIQEFLSELDSLFGIQNYTRRVIFQRDEKSDNSRTLAEILVDHTYQQVSISVYDRFFLEDTDAQIRCLIHELCHSVVWELAGLSTDLLDGKLVTADAIKNEDESATSQIQNIIFNLITDHKRYWKIYESYTKRVSPRKHARSVPKKGRKRTKKAVSLRGVHAQ